MYTILHFCCANTDVLKDRKRYTNSQHYVLFNPSTGNSDMWRSATLQIIKKGLFNQMLCYFVCKFSSHCSRYKKKKSQTPNKYYILNEALGMLVV